MVLTDSGKSGPNYDANSINICRAAMARAKVMHKGIMVDCSHGNSKKNHKNQPIVAGDVAAQIANGDWLIRGVMIESNINEGTSMGQYKPNLKGDKIFPWRDQMD